MLQYSVTTEGTHPGMYVSGGGNHNRMENVCSCFFKSLLSNLVLSIFVAGDGDVSLYALETTLAPFLCFQGSVFGFECLQFLNSSTRC